MSFQSRLKGHQFGISLNPFQWLFVIPDFAWKTKEKIKHTRIKFLNIFQMAGTIKTTLRRFLCARKTAPTTNFEKKKDCFAFFTWDQNWINQKFFSWSSFFLKTSEDTLRKQSNKMQRWRKKIEKLMRLENKWPLEESNHMSRASQSTAQHSCGTDV